MGLFKKKKDNPEELIQQNLKEAEEEAMREAEQAEKKHVEMGPHLERLAIQIEGLNEFRKATNERFNLINEQIGELRGNLTELTRAISKLEVAATRAVDKVEAVQPDKLFLTVQKQDAKIEALKANIESNEALIKDLMEMIKQFRQEVNKFKGIEQVVKLNEEVKKELLEIKKTESMIERHADRVESIFVEVEKSFSEFENFNSEVKALKRSFERIQSDLDKLKLKIGEKADKKEFSSLMNRFTKFEKHTTNFLNLLQARSEMLEKNAKKALIKAIDLALKKIEKKTGEVINREEIIKEAEASIGGEQEKREQEQVQGENKEENSAQ